MSKIDISSQSYIELAQLAQDVKERRAEMRNEMAEARAEAKQTLASFSMRRGPLNTRDQFAEPKRKAKKTKKGKKAKLRDSAE